MDDGPQSIEAEAELTQVRRQARAVRWKALLFALVATVLAMLLPVVPR